MASAQTLVTTNEKQVSPLRRQKRRLRSRWQSWGGCDREVVQSGTTTGWRDERFGRRSAVARKVWAFVPHDQTSWRRGPPIRNPLKRAGLLRLTDLLRISGRKRPPATSFGLGRYVSSRCPWSWGAN